jgi:hypothetical protein
MMMGANVASVMHSTIYKSCSDIHCGFFNRNVGETDQKVSLVFATSSCVRTFCAREGGGGNRSFCLKQPLHIPTAALDLWSTRH